MVGLLEVEKTPGTDVYVGVVAVGAQLLRRRVSELYEV